MAAAKRVAVFCGSSGGHGNKYLESAVRLADEMVKAGLELVYGGGHVGMMGAVADEVLKQNGTAIGVIPRFLVEREIAHKSLSELIIVESMHERKYKMADLSDIFVALPGGYGTLDEFFEIVTWSQLGLHKKPCILLNVHGYFDEIFAWIDKAAATGFVRDEHKSIILCANSEEEAVSIGLNYEHKIKPKWV